MLAGGAVKKAPMVNLTTVGNFLKSDFLLVQKNMTSLSPVSSVLSIDVYVNLNP